MDGDCGRENGGYMLALPRAGFGLAGAIGAYKCGNIWLI